MEDRAPAAAQVTAVIGQPPPADCDTKSFGHFDVLEPLGRGGCGVVVKAFDRQLRRQVAVKSMAADLAVASPARKRFVREARAAAAVRHENVVQIHAVGESPVPYLVMEYVPGVSLHRHLLDHGPLPAAEAVRIGAQVARGLAAAHDCGLVHRDVKPANILVEWAGGIPRVKLTDFGIARAADDASLTQSGTVMGTPLYMSPEQARGEAVDHRSDLFSLGSVLYEMLTGRPPFRAVSSAAVLDRVAEGTARPIRVAVPETPEWLCAVVSRLLRKNPADRFASAREVADALDHGPTAVPRSNRRRAAMSAAAVLTVLAAGVLAARRGTPADPDPVVPAVAAREPAPPAPPAAPEPAAPPGRTVVAAPTAVTQAIAAELRRANPRYAGTVAARVADGDVVELTVAGAADVKDIGPLARHRRLEVLRAGNPGFANLSPLAGLPLRELHLMNAGAVGSLAPLAGMRLEVLAMWGYSGDDLSPLRGMPLTYLNCGYCFKKRDLSPLRGMPLTYLCLNSTATADLSALEGMPLEELGLRHTGVTDLTPLRRSRLRSLQINNTRVTDLTPLAGLPLESLQFEVDPARDAAALRALPTLRRINLRPAGEFLAGAMTEE